MFWKTSILKCFLGCPLPGISKDVEKVHPNLPKVDPLAKFERFKHFHSKSERYDVMSVPNCVKLLEFEDHILQKAVKALKGTRFEIPWWRWSQVVPNSAKFLS